jgi:hypothetical protein
VSGPQVEEKPDDRNPEEPKSACKSKRPKPAQRAASKRPSRRKTGSAWGAANAIDSIVVQGEPSFQNEAEASRALERESK